MNGILLALWGLQPAAWRPVAQQVTQIASILPIFNETNCPGLISNSADGVKQRKY
jgi:hypothetical protein